MPKLLPLRRVMPDSSSLSCFLAELRFDITERPIDCPPVLDDWSCLDGWYSTSANLIILSGRVAIITPDLIILVNGPLPQA